MKNMARFYKVMNEKLQEEERQKIISESNELVRLGMDKKSAMLKVITDKLDELKKEHGRVTKIVLDHKKGK